MNNRMHGFLPVVKHKLLEEANVKNRSTRYSPNMTCQYVAAQKPEKACAMQGDKDYGRRTTDALQMVWSTNPRPRTPSKF